MCSELVAVAIPVRVTWGGVVAMVPCSCRMDSTGWGSCCYVGSSNVIIRLGRAFRQATISISDFVYCIISLCIAGSRNVFQRLSFNTLKQRKVNGADKLGE